MLLAAITSAIWGFGFVAGALALESFSPAQLTAIRFILVGMLVFLVPRPNISWWSIVWIGLTLFTGQFLLVFFAFTHGLPPGVASVSQQMQAFFTVLLAAIFLRDLPSLRQSIAMVMALVGLVLVGATSGGDLRLIGLGLGLGAAFSWAVGNVLVKAKNSVPVFPLVIWCSLVPPVPAMVVSILTDRNPNLLSAMRGASWLSLGAVVYLAGFATILAYASWGYLLQRYSTAAVAPFALLAPCSGIVSSAVVFSELPDTARLAGMVLILGGLAVVALPAAQRTDWPHG
jgi:O-acetylserine/cysteine efflux transporter